MDSAKSRMDDKEIDVQSIKLSQEYQIKKVDAISANGSKVLNELLN